MDTSLKVRVLLFLLTLCFVVTAITTKSFYNKKEILLLEGSKIEKNLHKKEAEARTFLATSALFDSLKNIHQNDGLARELIIEYGEKKQIYIYTYVENDLSFWGSNAIVPRTDLGINSGNSILAWDNGWYFAMKKSEGGFSVLCLIPISEKFLLENNYLENKISPDLSKSDNVEVAEFKDEEIYNLRDSEGKYLLSLKLSSHFKNYFSVFEFLMWIFAVISGSILVTLVCHWMAERGRLKLSILILTSYFFVIRYIDLSLQLISKRFYGGVFDPINYASSFFAPSLGALFLNILAITWIVLYIYNYRFKLQFKRKSLNRFQSVVIYVLFGIIIYFISVFLVDVFRGLINNSSINFNVTNILKLNVYSWIGVLSLCISLFNLYLIIEVLYVISIRLRITSKLRLRLFLGIVGFLLLLKLIIGNLTVSFFLFSLIIFIRIRLINERRDFHLAAFVSALLLFAAIASLKQGSFQEKKLEVQQYSALQKLESADDPNAVLLFLEIEDQLTESDELVDYISYPNLYDFHLLNEGLKKSHFGGYLSRYDFNAYLYDEHGQSNDSLANARLSYFKNKVIEGSRKVSKNFYRLNEDVGYLTYFALIPIHDGEQTVGLYLIELTNNLLGKRYVFPELLMEGRMPIFEDFRKYSFAFYSDGHLLNQSGQFLYPLSDDFFLGAMNNRIAGENNYTHLVYHSDEGNTVVLSSQNQSWWIQLASLSFLFLVFLSFSIVAYALHWLFRVLRDYDFSFRNLRWSIMISQNRILYSTRIQAFVVSAVVFTLITAGFITYFNLSVQYRHQQETTALTQAASLSASLQARMLSRPYDEPSMFINERDFNLMAEMSSLDLSLYGTGGNLIYSTQPKIFDLGLTSRQIDARAWLYLNNYRREEHFQRESIGNLNFPVSYASIKNAEKETIAYLSLPFYSNQMQLDEQLGLLLNTLINIYAFVIVALGLFTAFVANRITSPLTLVQRSLARTKIGRKNEPIFWKRNDEIGSLIKEYNNMIVALDHSAAKLMRAERESAWHEMAKQVAHEIKNPLTPLRLGVQLLDRAYRENDPDFDQKFERFSQSFIEQIESLNNIATEFSNFAKMPDTVLEDLDILSVIENATSLYADGNEVRIDLDIEDSEPIWINGDYDQLLRSFNNIIKNAVEAKLPNKICIIKIKVRSLFSGFVSIDITDNGRGIDMIIRDKIFQPNFTTKSSGTGLGLAFVKQALEAIGGTIRFTTETMRGTTFYILIPLKNIGLDESE